MTPSHRIAALIVMPATVSIGLLFACPAWAGSLATSPFPGEDLVSGLVRCRATNLGDKPSELTKMTMVGLGGTPLRDVGPITVGPGQTVVTIEADLQSESPMHCTFRFKGKFKGSLAYRYGTDVEVVPASK